MKYILSTLLFCCVCGMTQAQNASDALRYSFLELGGTARTVGLGGAIGAFGGDFSVVSTNPAGLATYRASELTFTPTLVISNNSSRLLNSDGVDTSVNRARFNFNNLGLVIASRPRGKMKTFNFALGFNRIANFNREFSYSGKSVGSYADRFVELATDLNGNPLAAGDLDLFEAGLANLTGAIFVDQNTGNWSNDFAGGPEVQKSQRIRARGALNELVFGMGGNYDNKLQFGATLGIPILRYSERKTYTEEDTGTGRDGDIPFFNDLRFVEDLTTSGIGINLKLGLIYRFNQAFRLGIAAHTPTAYSLDDTYFTELEYSFNGNNGLEERLTEPSPTGSFDYGLRTPWRVITSAGFLIQRRGFISAEVEWLDYSSANLNLTRNSSATEDQLYEREVNDDIENLYQSALNIRLGGELAFNDYRVRLGTGFTGTPYQDGDILYSYYTAGFGYRSEGFFVDLAYRILLQEEGYVPYLMESVADQQLVNNDFINHKIMMTMGFRF